MKISTIIAIFGLFIGQTGDTPQVCLVRAALSLVALVLADRGH